MPIIVLRLVQPTYISTIGSTPTKTSHTPFPGRYALSLCNHETLHIYILILLKCTPKTLVSSYNIMLSCIYKQTLQQLQQYTSKLSSTYFYSHCSNPKRTYSPRQVPSILDAQKRVCNKQFLGAFTARAI
jgi:hypothetical protein